MRQSTSPALERLYESDPSLAVWWWTELECVSAVSRLERDKEITAPGAVQALDRLDRLVSEWSEIAPSRNVRTISRRLLRTHPLRAGDAMQLAAAIIASENAPSELAFVALDKRLVAAAHREGLAVVELG